jgi:hypothetical protein
MLPFLQCDLWSIIGDSGFVVSSLVSSASVFFSFHLLTGKTGTRPVESASVRLLFDTLRLENGHRDDQLGNRLFL